VIKRENIPNILTTMRLVAIPVMALLYWQGMTTLAGTLFVAAAVTDALDGYLARRWRAQSQWGQVADPIADRVLVNTAVLLLYLDGLLPVWAFILWARDIVFILLLVVYRRRVHIQVNIWGKAATALIMMSLSALMLFGLGLELFYAGFALAMVAFVVYYLQRRKLLERTDNSAE
jgi:cardiolipin synthase